jgi:hypothetical protein
MVFICSYMPMLWSKANTYICTLLSCSLWVCPLRLKFARQGVFGSNGWSVSLWVKYVPMGEVCPYGWSVSLGVKLVLRSVGSPPLQRTINGLWNLRFLAFFQDSFRLPCSGHDTLNLQQHEADQQRLRGQKWGRDEPGPMLWFRKYFRPKMEGENGVFDLKIILFYSKNGPLHWLSKQNRHFFPAENMQKLPF